MFCGSCGAGIEGDYLFCPECGTRLMVAKEEGPLPQPKGVTSQQQASISSVHPSLDGAPGLLPGETVLRMFRAKNFGDLRTRGTKGASSYSGLLLVTDRRLFFLIEAGTFQKRTAIGEEIDLATVQMVNVEGFLDKYLVIRYVRFNLIYSIGFDDFEEVDPSTLKGTAKVPLQVAQKVLEDALAKMRRGSPGP